MRMSIVCEEDGEDDDNAADAGDDGCVHQVISGCQMLRVHQLRLTNYDNLHGRSLRQSDRRS